MPSKNIIPQRECDKKNSFRLSNRSLLDQLKHDRRFPRIIGKLEDHLEKLPEEGRNRIKAKIEQYIS